MRDLRSMLERKADEMRIDTAPPTSLLRRSRRRRVGTAVLASALAGALGAGAYAGLDRLMAVGGRTPRVQPAVSPTTSVGAEEAEALPDPVADTRQALLDAARARDWDGLGTLIPERGFTFTFGDAKDPIGFWQGLESEGEGVLEILVTLLERPEHGVSRSTFVWPEAATEAPAAWNEADIRTLRPIYTPRQIEEFRELDLYYGWRVGIDADGTWVFLIEGD